jgi:hypothetical protein
MDQLVKNVVGKVVELLEGIILGAHSGDSDVNLPYG